MTKFAHEWEHDGVVTTFIWLGEVDAKLNRVYAFAFTSDREMLLVTNPEWRPAGWLPGGGIEDGESAEQALARELVEEANATLNQLVKIGTQRADHSSGERSYLGYYWCRVTLANKFLPKHEITERFLVTPDEFLDRLFWGRTDPAATMLLECALEMEQNHEFGGVSTSPDCAYPD